MWCECLTYFPELYVGFEKEKIFKIMRVLDINLCDDILLKLFNVLITKKILIKEYENIYEIFDRNANTKYYIIITFQYPF